MSFNTLDEWLAANPIYRWRASQTDDGEVPVPMQVVADATGTTRTTVMFWERGDFTPKYPYLVKLAELLNYESADALYTIWQAWLDAKPVEAGTPVPA
jgi:transcriptional regulator with XRE-family HTH domain